MRTAAQARTQAQNPHLTFLRRTSLTLIVLFATATVALAETIIKSHGYSRFGELKYPADFAHLDYVNPDAPKGGEISSWAQGQFDSLHRYSTKGEQAGSATIFFESLMAGTADEAGSLYGLLAETIEYPESKKWVIFNLRPEARFSDGSPLTASDVVFSLNILVEKGLPTLKSVYGDVVAVEALDPHRVKFTFTEDLPISILSEQIQLVSGTPVFSEAWWSGTDPDGEPRDFAESTIEAPLGSGPYVLDEMEVGRMISYRYNPDYWGADLPINVGQNNFERIRYEYYADPVAAFEGFKAGSYTYRSENSSKNWASAYDFPAVENGWVRKVELPDGGLGSAQNFIFNLRLEKFQDPRVREAIGLPFNFEWSNEALFFGLYARVQSFWANSPMEASGPPSPEEVAILEPLAEHFPDDILTADAVSWPESSVRQLDRRAIRSAGALLDEAGWTVGDDGLRRNADGELLEIEFLTYSPLFDRIINPYIENLENIGVKAVLNRVDTGTYVTRLDDFDFEVMTHTFGMSLSPGIGLRQWYHSDSANTNSGGRNMPGLSNPGIDALVERVISAESQEEMELNTRVLDRALRSLKFSIPQWFKDVYTVAYWDMYEHPETIPPYALGVMGWWWYNPEKHEKLKAEGAL